MTSTETSSGISRPFHLTRLERCAVLLRLGQDSVITESDAIAILEQCFDLTGRRQYVLYVELDKVSSISSGARRVLMSARDVLACAMVGAEPMDRMLSVPYELADYPSEYFTERSTALEWLSLMHDVLCADPVEHAMSLTVDRDPFPRRRAG
ncbi:DUF7793 family protein [Arthrobacter sedimenti]|uniref:DUF7793 family protein n=1 Tax=Arthrobacter sedimenti TaxID=2694931 RepID=UPI000B35E174|nr:hypothetical protein [Arthrobacter sedimenti]OUM42660.1 hypothetical protein B8W73_07485 [Arthrobacter agilis]